MRRGGLFKESEQQAQQPEAAAPVAAKEAAEEEEEEEEAGGAADELEEAEEAEEADAEAGEPAGPAAAARGMLGAVADTVGGALRSVLTGTVGTGGAGAQVGVHAVEGSWGVRMLAAAPPWPDAVPSCQSSVSPLRPALQEARRAPTKQVPTAAQAKGKGKKGGASQARWWARCVHVLVGVGAVRPWVGAGCCSSIIPRLLAGRPLRSLLVRLTGVPARPVCRRAASAGGTRRSRTAGEAGGCVWLERWQAVCRCWPEIGSSGGPAAHGEPPEG